MAFGPTDFDSLGVKRQWVDGSIAMLQNGIRSVENLAKYPIVFVQCLVVFTGGNILYVLCTFTQFHTLLMEVQVAIRQDLFEVLSSPSQNTRWYFTVI